MVGRTQPAQGRSIMSDAKKAALAFAKLEAQVESHGLQMTDGTTGPHSHVISGGLDGTYTLDAFHGPQYAQQNGQDTFDLTINGGHNFNLTIQNFNPALWLGGTPSGGQLFGDTYQNHHDLLALKFDPSSGITNFTQAAAAETYEVVNHDLVLHIDAPNVHGEITLVGLADLVPPGHTDHFAWVNEIGSQHQVV
jgi:hypothetical protein